jgi:hypothetical protein
MYCPGIFLAILSRTMYQYSRCTGRVSNRIPPKYERFGLRQLGR